jgi:hypothetical protein
MALDRRRRRLTLQVSAIGCLVTIIVLAFEYAPGWLWGDRPARAVDPVFPSTVARYSWYTGMLSSDRFQAASLLYQNGVGVEFMDTPQSVLLSTDGSTYRRLDEAEALSIPEDQGDPATSVLSPDGTFVVVASAGRTGEVQVITLRDGRRSPIPVGGKRTALPVSIGRDGRTVLLTTSDKVVDRYAETDDLGLARLDLQTHQVLDYPEVKGVHAAALSPDGSRILITSARGLELIDAVTGRVTTTLPGSPELSLDGDAWSADGQLVALMDRSVLVILDVSGAQPVQRRLPLSEPEYGSAIGWRDKSTVLIHGSTNGDENTSELYWVDATTGEQEPFASYTPNFTGASLLRVDAARDLVPQWQVTERPVDRGPLPLRLGMLLAAIAGLCAALMASVFARSAPR